VLSIAAIDVPPGCCSLVGLISYSHGIYGADRLTRNEGSKSIPRPPSVSPIVILSKNEVAYQLFIFAAASTHAPQSLLQRYDAPQPSCRRHQNSACGRPNAPQWHPAEAILCRHCRLIFVWPSTTSSGMIRKARLCFIHILRKILNGHFRFHIELDLPLQEDTPR